VMGAVLRIPLDAPIPRVSRRTVRTLAWATRAARRKSIRALGMCFGTFIFSTKALAALGRLDAEDQARLVEAVQRDPRWPRCDLPLEQRALAWGAYIRGAELEPSVRRIRVRDIPGEIIRCWTSVSGRPMPNFRSAVGRRPRARPGGASGSTASRAALRCGGSMPLTLRTHRGGG